MNLDSIFVVLEEQTTANARQFDSLKEELGAVVRQTTGGSLEVECGPEETFLWLEAQNAHKIMEALDRVLRASELKLGYRVVKRADTGFEERTNY